MKIIDLLNKISNGEEVPKKIKYTWFYEWSYDNTRDEYCYMQKDGNRFDEDWLIERILNDEIEIIEEVEDIGYEVIEEITYKPRKVQNAINALIRNQNKIIERMERDE